MASDIFVAAPRARPARGGGEPGVTPAGTGRLARRDSRLAVAKLAGRTGEI